MKKITLAALALVAMSGTAFAADLTPMVPVLPPSPPPMATPVFTWTGPYVGVYGGVIPSNTPSAAWEAGATLGVNLGSGGPLVWGLEAKLGALFVPGLGTVFQSELDGRLGFALGAEGRALLYGKGGVGFITGGAGGYWDVGGGMEFALSQRTSIFADATFVHQFGVAGGAAQIQFGLNWHFGGGM